LIVSRSDIPKLEMFRTNVAQGIKTHTSYSVTVFFKSCRLWDNVETDCRDGQATDHNIIWLTYIACWVPKATSTQS